MSDAVVKLDAKDGGGWRLKRGEADLWEGSSALELEEALRKAGVPSRIRAAREDWQSGVTPPLSLRSYLRALEGRISRLSPGGDRGSVPESMLRLMRLHPTQRSAYVTAHASDFAPDARIEQVLGHAHAEALEAHLSGPFQMAPLYSAAVSEGFGPEMLSPARREVWRRHARELEDALALRPSANVLWFYWSRAALADPGSVVRLLERLPAPVAGDPLTWPPLRASAFGQVILAVKRVDSTEAWKALAAYLDPLARGLLEQPRNVGPGLGDLGNPVASFPEPGMNDGAWSFVVGPRLEALLRLGRLAEAKAFVPAFAESALTAPWLSYAAALSNRVGHPELAQAWSGLRAMPPLEPRSPGGQTWHHLELRNLRPEEALRRWTATHGLGLISRPQDAAAAHPQWRLVHASGRELAKGEGMPDPKALDELLNTHRDVDLPRRLDAALRLLPVDPQLRYWRLQLEDLPMEERCRRLAALFQSGDMVWLLGLAATPPRPAFPGAAAWPLLLKTPEAKAMGLADILIRALEPLLIQQPANPGLWAAWRQAAPHAEIASLARLIDRLPAELPEGGGDPVPLTSLRELVDLAIQTGQERPLRSYLDERWTRQQARWQALPSSDSRRPGGAVNHDWTFWVKPHALLCLHQGEEAAARTILRTWIAAGGSLSQATRPQPSLPVTSEMERRLQSLIEAETQKPR